MADARRFIAQETAAHEAANTARLKQAQQRHGARAIPFPDASDPQALVASGSLLDLSSIASRISETAAGDVVGFVNTVGVYATPEAATAMERVGVRSVLLSALYVHQQVVRDASGRRRQFIATDFSAGEPRGWFTYFPCPTVRGATFGVIASRDESCPAWRSPEEV